jgi:beta-lactam-binding protein with PASTA domain
VSCAVAGWTSDRAMVQTDCVSTWVQVPMVIGLRKDAASQGLRAAGLCCAIREDTQSSKTEGVVTSQSPGPGQFVPEGTTINLELAVPPE